MNQLIEGLFDFIRRSPTACHTVQTVRELLAAQDFQELTENDSWELTPGGKYFTVRSMTSVIAFRYPESGISAFSIIAPHGDAPCFKVKGSPEMKVEGRYTRLNTEVYGGMLINRWADRPLSVAGRLVVRTEQGVKAVLTDIDRDLLIIPGLAPHMDREGSQAGKQDPQRDTLPLLGGKETDLLALAAECAGVKKEDVLSHDLYLYNRAKGSVIGAGEEFIAAPKLDDLECAYSAVTAFLRAEQPAHCPILAIFDNEETGSMTRQGAGSTFLADVIARICGAAGLSDGERRRAVQNGMMLSADNAHAVHPNYPEKADPTSRCYMNGGPVIKHSSSYATDAVTSGVFRRICEKAGVPVQDFYNHSSNPGGGTLGLISGRQVAVPTVDVGLPQLSMHSPYETAGAEDLSYLVDAMTAFYQTALTWKGSGECELG